MPVGSITYSCGPSVSYVARSVLAPHGLQEEHTMCKVIHGSIEGAEVDQQVSQPQLKQDLAKLEADSGWPVATSYCHQQAVKSSDSALAAAGVQERLDALHCSQQL